MLKFLKSSYDEASTVIGSVSLQGIRLLSPTYDETIVVSGLVWLVSIQILKSNGCRVIAFDNDDNKVLCQELMLTMFQILTWYN